MGVNDAALADYGEVAMTGCQGECDHIAGLAALLLPQAEGTYRIGHQVAMIAAKIISRHRAQPDTCRSGGQHRHANTIQPQANAAPLCPEAGADAGPGTGNGSEAALADGAPVHSA